MTDQFASTVAGLLRAFDSLKLDPSSLTPLDAAAVRPLLSQARWVACQRDNPFRDWNLGELLAMDFADSLISWLDAREKDPDKWELVLECRESVRDVCDSDDGDG